MLILACILSAAVQDWEDLFIIFAMLFLNACIAFYEETKAMASLDALKGELKQRVSVLRDGVPVILEAAELVPGDVVSLRGGQAVPADVLWLSGDSIKLDTAALTGEPIPWTIPRRLATREAESSAQSEDDRQDEQKKDETKAAEPAKISDSPEMAASVLPNATGRRMLSGCVVVQGECQCYVTTTGVRTEIGQAAQMVAASKSGPRPRGLFESKIIAIVTMLITATLAITVVVFVYLLARSGTDLSHALLVSLSLVIGAVPIALPLVLQVTMALGAREMAEHGAIVTHTTALQEIASMTVLNSDKTGTLTTAKMSIIPDMIWLADDDDITRAVTTLVDNKRFTADDCLLLAALASNPTNLDDPIDAAVFQAVRARFAEPGAADAKHPRHAAGAKARLATYGQREKFDGFNPNVKRAVARYRLKNNAKLRVAKGLLNKILDTGGDGAAEQWICAGIDRELYAAEDAIASKIAEEASQDACFSATIGRDEPPLRAEAAACAARQLGGGVRARALAADAALSAVGYKTIAVCAAFFDEESGAVDNMRLVGLIPMLDPPRHDTASTIHALRRAGVAVKMITGDHVNIARETARLIGLGDNILPQCSLWPASATRDETIWQADGFAQVMPVDKREVVLVLQNRGLVLASVRTIYARVCASRSRVRVLQVVGMTGDGVNDAAALAQAQVGIAVEGATDAATNAADIVLTRQGAFQVRWQAERDSQA